MEAQSTKPPVRGKLMQYPNQGPGGGNAYPSERGKQDYDSAHSCLDEVASNSETSNGLETEKRAQRKTGVVV